MAARGAEMLPDWIMEIANELELIVMLHIPRKQRLADSLNQKQVVFIMKDMVIQYLQMMEMLILQS